MYFRVLFLLMFSSCCFAINDINPYTIVTESNKPKFYILVSTSMPKQSLQALAHGADLLGEPLTIQGFVNNSIKDTTAKAKELFIEHEIGEFSVNPEVFSQLNITMVPAFVIATHHDFDVVFGNISLKSALEILIRQGNPNNVIYAEKLLAKL